MSKKKLKIFIPLILTVLLLAGGSYAYIRYFSGDKPVPSPVPVPSSAVSASEAPTEVASGEQRSTEAASLDPALPETNAAETEQTLPPQTDPPGFDHGMPVGTDPAGPEVTLPPQTDPPETEKTLPPQTDPPGFDHGVPVRTDAPETEQTLPPQTDPPGFDHGVPVQTDPPETQPSATETPTQPSAGGQPAEEPTTTTAAPTTTTAAPTTTQAQTGPGGITVTYGSSYSDKDHVALYIHLYGWLPPNYITKSQAEALGWKAGKSLWNYASGKSIGGDVFSNREGRLPKKSGRTYYECDIDYNGSKSRNSKRIVFSNDGLIFYTSDHYETFTQLY